MDALRGGDANKCLRGAPSTTKPFSSTGLVMPVMPGSSDAVKSVRSHVSARDSSKRSATSAGQGMRSSSGSLSRIAWAPQGDLSHADWLATGRRLGAIGRCSQWWIGDWIRYGTSRWGEKYAEAARVTGYDVASLRNMAWVASRFDLSLRNDKLTWSHHVLLAPLDADAQGKWLRRASEERLSVADLRLELRASRAGGGKSSRNAAVATRDRGDIAVCPHCGHVLRAT
jgi:hypothetical protein